MLEEQVAGFVAATPASVMGDRLKLKLDFAPSSIVQETTVDVLTPVSVFVAGHHTCWC